jgi:sulfite exporter TauE/SafE
VGGAVLPLLATGLLGSFHCVGMCGGFVLSIDRRGRPSWRRVGAQAAFHLGKAATYVLLGGVVGALGATFVHARGFTVAQAVLAVAAGVLMVLAGLQLLGLLKDLPLGRLFGPGSAYARAVHGVLNLVYAFLAYAASTGSVLSAMGTMGLLALCSVPALVAVAFGGALLAPGVRARWIRVGGGVVVLLGLVTLARGLAPEWIHFGHHA